MEQQIEGATETLIEELVTTKSEREIDVIERKLQVIKRLKE
jgi:hypothetical protein